MPTTITTTGSTTTNITTNTTTPTTSTTITTSIIILLLLLLLLNTVLVRLLSGLLSEVQAAEAAAENSSMSQPSHDTESMDYQTHIAVECMRLAYADALQYVCDPDPTRNPVTIARDSATRLLHPLYLHQRAAGIDRQHASEVTMYVCSMYVCACILSVSNDY